MGVLFLILGNFLGTDITGTVSVANAYGVFIDAGASKNTVGATVAGSGNLIAFNSSYGVDVASSTCSGNAILMNSTPDTGCL